MDIFELIKARHSVRQYSGKKIEEDKRKLLDTLAEECNRESGLRIQIIYDEPKCFDSRMAHYGKFSGVENYIALVGKKDAGLEEKAGYFGEKLVLKAQELGLNTCWVALTHGKVKADIGAGEKLACIIALGYGATQGIAHRSKETGQLCNCADAMPDWFAKGMEAAMLAPTAINQQKFYFTLENGNVSVRAGRGPYAKMDLGIVKYHFEAVSGHEVEV
ncbi:MAG: nitroreductase [Muribaculaceae bacterium]|nr:nitroreductase [bacterium]MCM1494119.1 nitroreductase [Muribaculaceae bacterium]